MLFEIYRGASKFINSIWYTEGLCQQLIFSDILSDFPFVSVVSHLKRDPKLTFLVPFSCNEFLRPEKMTAIFMKKIKDNDGHFCILLNAKE